MLGESRIIYGSMGLGGSWDDQKLESEEIKKAEEAFNAALEIGITYFDFADIYTNGKSEKVFGEFIKGNPGLREKVKIQTKAGIILPHQDGIGRFDFSSTHIIKAVEGSLKRLNVDRIDSLLLHRPDPLMDPDALKVAFDYLFDNALIGRMGVSNMNQHQIRFVEQAVGRKVTANQLEMSLQRLDWLDSTIGVNNDEGFKSAFTPGIIEYSMVNKIELQAWSPMARGIYSGKKLGHDTPQNSVDTRDYVYELAGNKETTPGSIVLAFLLKHPAGIRPVIGTSKANRILEIKDAEDVELSRREWYKLYILSRGEKLP